MYPTAYTLTVLVLTLLQLSFDKHYLKNSCSLTDDENNNLTLCQTNVRRKEIRELSAFEFSEFTTIFNEYFTKNGTAELNNAISELGVVQIFDELLRSKKVLTPYWDYRMELALEDGNSSSLWTSPQFDKIQRPTNAVWISEFLNTDSPNDEEAFFFEENSPLKALWDRRKSALKILRNWRQFDVFWHFLLLVSMESGMDQMEVNITRPMCMREFGRFGRWVNEKCIPTVGDGFQCATSGDCFHRRCSKNVCIKSEYTQRTTTPLPKTTPMSSTPESTTVIKEKKILKEKPYSTLPLPTTTPTTPDIKSTSTASPTASQTTLQSLLKSTRRPTEFPILTAAEITSGQHQTPQDPIELMEPPKGNPWSLTMAVTTEFLAKELSTVPPKEMQKSRQKNRRKNKGKQKAAKIEEAFDDNINPTFSFPQSPNLTEHRIEDEDFGTDTLDALLAYMPAPKVPHGMIPWNSKFPFRMAYFTFAIIEGNLGKNRRLKEKGHKRAKGARIYIRGLDMPHGYVQVTQGKQQKMGTTAIARTLHPENNGPFVEFKLRVENRYGAACKQMCLDSNQRYRRCARRTVRLSTYKRFSDPIPYYDNEEAALERQWMGKGYYRKRRPSYLLFKCD